MTSTLSVLHMLERTGEQRQLSREGSLMIGLADSCSHWMLTLIMSSVPTATRLQLHNRRQRGSRGITFCPLFSHDFCFLKCQRNPQIMCVSYLAPLILHPHAISFSPSSSPTTVHTDTDTVDVLMLPMFLESSV